MEKINKILIVEDELIIAANISMQLTSLGYTIIVIIPRAEEVLVHLETNLTDIILMDINLKGNLDGIEIACLIQKRYNSNYFFDSQCR